MFVFAESLDQKSCAPQRGVKRPREGSSGRKRVRHHWSWVSFFPLWWTLEFASLFYYLYILKDNKKSPKLCLIMYVFILLYCKSITNLPRFYFHSCQSCLGNCFKCGDTCREPLRMGTGFISPYPVWLCSWKLLLIQKPGLKTKNASLYFHVMLLWCLKCT